MNIGIQIGHGLGSSQGAKTFELKTKKRVQNLIFVVCNVFNSNIYVIFEGKEGQVMN